MSQTWQRQNRRRNESKQKFYLDQQNELEARDPSRLGKEARKKNDKNSGRKGGEEKHEPRRTHTKLKF
jgi:hypothetical protein